MAVVGDVPTLMLFTSKKIALEFAEKNNLTAHADGCSVDFYPVPEAMEGLQSYSEKGVEMVQFNGHHPAGAWQGPISLLCAGFEWHIENDARFQE